MLEIILKKEIIGPIIIVVVFLFVYLIFKNIIKKIVSKNIKPSDKRKKTLIGLFNNLIKYFFIILALLMILSIYGIDTTALLTSLGIVGVIAGLALQDILKDFLSGISIITENQYAVGDIVTINEFKGEVISLGIKTTKIKSSQGEIKFIANRNINEVINHSLIPSLAVVDVLVKYNVDIDKVEKILNTLFIKLNKEIKNLKKEIQLLGIEELGTSFIKLRIVAETEPMKHFELQRILRKEIKVALDNNNIQMPQEQLVINNA